MEQEKLQEQSGKPEEDKSLSIEAQLQRLNEKIDRVLDEAQQIDTMLGWPEDSIEKISRGESVF